MFLGFNNVGDTLVRDLLTKNSSGTPSTADSAPTFRIYSGASTTPVATGTLTHIDSGNVTGLYQLSQVVSSGNGFGRGAYTVIVQYAISSAARADAYTFFLT